ncbi:hypothetical protein [Labrys neptuniae]
MEPGLFKEFCEEFTREMNRLRMEGRASIDAAEAEFKRIERELDKIMDLYLKDAMSIETVKQRSHKLEARKNELTRFLRDAEEPPPLLHPNMAAHYRTQVEGLYLALQDDSRGEGMAAAEQIRSLMREIVLTPEGGELQIDVRGDLAGILTLSAQTKNPAAFATGSQLKMVAGAGSNHYLRSLQAHRSALETLLSDDHSGLFRTAA